MKKAHDSNLSRLTILLLKKEKQICLHDDLQQYEHKLNHNNHNQDYYRKLFVTGNTLVLKFSCRVYWYLLHNYVMNTGVRCQFDNR